MLPSDNRSVLVHGIVEALVRPLGRYISDRWRVWMPCKAAASPFPFLPSSVSPCSALAAWLAACHHTWKGWSGGRCGCGHACVCACAYACSQQRGGGPSFSRRLEIWNVHGDGATQVARARTRAGCLPSPFLGRVGFVPFIVAMWLCFVCVCVVVSKEVWSGGRTNGISPFPPPPLHTYHGPSSAFLFCPECSLMTRYRTATSIRGKIMGMKCPSASAWRHCAHGGTTRWCVEWRGRD